MNQIRRLANGLSYPPCPEKKKVPFFVHVINRLLTKLLQSRRLDIGFVFSIKTQNRTWSSLRSLAVLSAEKAAKPRGAWERDNLLRRFVLRKLLKPPSYAS